jgi:hypothetical protein
MEDVKATAAASVLAISQAVIAAHARMAGWVRIVISRAAFAIMDTVAALRILNANAMAATPARSVKVVEKTCLESIAASNVHLRIAAGMDIAVLVENASVLKVTLEHHVNIAQAMPLATRANHLVLGIPHAVLMGVV